MLVNKSVGWVVCLVGILIFAGGGWYAFEATRFLIDTETTSGEIVDHEFMGGSSAGFREVGSRQTQVTNMYAPIVTFRTPTGIDVRFRANWSEGEPPAIGTPVKVRYPPQSPYNARISGLSSLYGGAFILFLIGAVFAGAGALILRVTGRPGNPER